MGQLPSAVTSAVPQWVPVSVRAGHPAKRDAREQRLGSLRRLTEDDHSRPVAWSPDGKRLLYIRGGTTQPCGTLMVVDLGTARAESIAVAGSAVTGATFAAADRLVVAVAPAGEGACAPPPATTGGGSRESDLVAISIASGEHGSTAAAHPAPRPVVAGPGYQGEPSAAPSTGLLVFTGGHGGDADLYAAATSGGPLTRLTRAAGYDGGARLSPDGSKLVWQATRPPAVVATAAPPPAPSANGAASAPPPGPPPPATTPSLVIMLAGSRGQHPRTIVDAAGRNLTPSFAADSRRVLYASDFDDGHRRGAATANFEIYLVDPDGPITTTGRPRSERITYHSGDDRMPLMSPDGHWLAFASSRASTAEGASNVFVARWLTP